MAALKNFFKDYEIFLSHDLDVGSLFTDNNSTMNHQIRIANTQEVFMGAKQFSFLSQLAIERQKETQKEKDNSNIHSGDANVVSIDDDSQSQQA